MAGGEHVGGADRDDVARRAGVSSASVSRAYNNPSSVSASKLKLIFDAAKSLGYKPNRNASGLRRKGDGSILLVLNASSASASDSSEGRVYRWFYAEALIRAQAALADSPYRLAIGFWNGRESLQRFLSKNACAGAVFGIGTFDESTALKLKRLALPHVLCSQMEFNTSSPLCYIDELAGGALAAECLLKAGRRKLAHVTELKNGAVCQARWEGFRSRAAKAGVDAVLIDGELGVQGGLASAFRLAPLAQERGVDGLFVVNDLTAVGVVQGLLQKGISIPSQLALVAYDNLPIRNVGQLCFASIDVSIGQLYETAVRALEGILKGDNAEPFRRAVKPVLAPGPSLPL